MLKELILLSFVAVVFYTTGTQAGDYKYSIAYNPKGYASYKCPKNYRRTDLDFKNRAHWTLMRYGTKDNPACAIRNTKAKCFSKDGHKKNWVTFTHGYGEFHISKHEHFSDMDSSSRYYPKYSFHKGSKKWYGDKKHLGYKKGRYYGSSYRSAPSSRRYSSTGIFNKPGHSSYSRTSSMGYKKGYPHSSYSSYGKHKKGGKGKKYTKKGKGKKHKKRGKGKKYKKGGKGKNYNKKGKGKKGNYYKKHGSYKYPSSRKSSYRSSYGGWGSSYNPSSYRSYAGYGSGPSSGGYGHSDKYPNSYSSPRGSSYGGHSRYISGSYPHGSSKKGYKYPGSSYPPSHGSSGRSSRSYSNTAVPVTFAVRALYFKVRGMTAIEIKFHGPISKTINIKKGKELDPRKKTWICIQFETFPVFREIWFNFKFGSHQKAKFWDLYLFSCCENLKDKINFD